MTKTANREEFYIVGIAARTSNDREMSGQGVIGKQWERFSREHVLEHIPNRADFNVYAVYTDYAGDENGEYTFLLGTKVRDLSQVPEGMIAKRVPAGKYAVVTSDRGPVVETIVGAWRKIWSATPSDLGGERAFQTDFELYDQRSSDPQNSQVDIYVGVK
jgi:predicted transcriptional regulator YdeE